MSATSPDFPRLLQDFFLRWLVAQRGASRHTIASYRDSFELLLRFLALLQGESARIRLPRPALDHVHHGRTRSHVRTGPARGGAHVPVVHIAWAMCTCT